MINRWSPVSNNIQHNGKVGGKDQQQLNRLTLVNPEKENQINFSSKIKTNEKSPLGHKGDEIPEAERKTKPEKKTIAYEENKKQDRTFNDAMLKHILKNYSKTDKTLRCSYLQTVLVEKKATSPKLTEKDLDNLRKATQVKTNFELKLPSKVINWLKSAFER